MKWDEWRVEGAGRRRAEGEREHKKLLFILLFLRYFGQWMGSGWGAKGERLGLQITRDSVQ